MEHPLPFFALDVERNRTLATIGQSDGEVDSATVRADTLRDEATIGVAFGAIDPNDVGAPIGQKCAGDRYEDPLREFDDPDAVERTFSHCPQSALGRRPGSRVRSESGTRCSSAMHQKRLTRDGVFHQPILSELSPEACPL